MKIKKCRKIVDEIFDVLFDAGALDCDFPLSESTKEACAKIIKARLEGGECQH